MRFLAGVRIPGLILSALIGVLVGLGAYTARYAEGLAYLSNDPKACVNCHIMRDQYDGWQKASHHAAATCNDCHVPHALIPKLLSKTRNGFVHSKGFTFQDFHEPIRIRSRNRQVLVENCIGCHRDVVSEIAAHSLTGSDVLDCLRCHDSVGHGPTR